MIYALTDGAGIGLDERPRPDRRRRRRGLPGRAACRSSGAGARRCCGCRCSRRASSTRSTSTTVLFYGALTAAGYLLVLQCQLRLGYSAAAGRRGADPRVGGLPRARAAQRRAGGARRPALADGRRDGGLVAAFAGLVSRPSARRRATSTGVLPGALLWGLGLGLSVTPLTAAVLAAVGDADLGEASAINDAASRVGGVIAIALVPALIGATVGTSLADALATATSRR